MYSNSRLLIHHLQLPKLQILMAFGVVCNTPKALMLFETTPRKNLLMCLLQWLPCRCTCLPLSPSEYDTAGKKRCQFLLAWQVVWSGLMEQAMSLKNSPFEHDQARLLVGSWAQDSEKRRIPTLQRGTAMSGQWIRFSIPLKCSSGDRILLFLMNECEQHQGQSQCVPQLLSLIGKPSHLACRFVPNAPSQDHWHQMFVQFAQVGSNESNPTGGGGWWRQRLPSNWSGIEECNLQEEIDSWHTAEILWYWLHSWIACCTHLSEKLQTWQW